MEKAFEILKEYKNIDYGCDMGDHKERCEEAIAELEEYHELAESIRMLCDDRGGYIAELEEAMKPKECSKCKHIHQGWWCNENGIKVTLDFCCNRYKPKDNA